jgi:hypothetical protein
MVRAAIAVALVLLSVRAFAQQRDSTRAVDSAKVSVGLGDWLKGYPTDPPNGVLFRFDYTKLLQWLIPKKKPLIPPDCDPKNMHDWMPDTTKPDSTKIKMPV